MAAKPTISSFARCARQSRDRQQQRKRNDDVIRDALLETERAGRKLEHVFEEPGAGERRQAERERRAGRGGGGFGGNPIGPACLHLCFTAIFASPPSRRARSTVNSAAIIICQSRARAKSRAVDAAVARLYRIANFGAHGLVGKPASGFPDHAGGPCGGTGRRARTQNRVPQGVWVRFPPRAPTPNSDFDFEVIH